ncbi:MAG: hypothetical protein JKY46_01920 [Robiginitomaculum sp.]|nr:hypothetical protein [Robiginitomaculum sp.]
MPSFYRVRIPNYVTQRANGIYEIRYPIPEDVQRFYPRKDGTGFRKLIIKSLGTRDPKEAKSKEVEFISEFEAKCKVLKGGVDKDHLEEILSRMYAGELHEFDLGRIDGGRLTDNSIYGLETKRLNLTIFKGLKGEEAQSATVDAYVRQVLLYLGVAKDPWEIEDTSSLSVFILIGTRAHKNV